MANKEATIILSIDLIKQRQIAKAKKKHPDRVNMLELIKKSNITLSPEEEFSLLIHGDIRRAGKWKLK